MNCSPLISVIIPIHNGARWISETLESLFAQTEPNFEIILVNDASTDNLHLVLENYPDKRLRVENLTHQSGESGARNRGIDLAQGRYIAFCDADDICQPERFARQIEFFATNPEIDLCGSAFTCFDPNIRETITNPCSQKEIRRALMYGNCFGVSTIMVRAESMRKYRFDEKLRAAPDYDLWTRMAINGIRMANLPESLVHYRLHPGQASRLYSVQLDQVSRRIRSHYCAVLLGNADLATRVQEGKIFPEDLEFVAREIMRFIKTNPEYTTRDFRYLLAWIYQQLPSHGMRSWWNWVRIQNELNLLLDRNYRLNIFLLAILPFRISAKQLDVLLKLKR